MKDPMKRPKETTALARFLENHTVEELERLQLLFQKSEKGELERVAALALGDPEARNANMDCGLFERRSPWVPKLGWASLFIVWMLLLLLYSFAWIEAGRVGGE